ncbi:MAG TPA: phosphopantetheine-binding protein [Proteiniclasticum sp.]|nr:phosphopantetheine-binding protein [Proteiniclasticum sp.]
MKDYRKIVGDALSDAVGIEIEEGQYGLDLIEHGLVDSLAMMNIIMHMEENLGQRIDSKNFTNDDFRSFNSIRSLIEKL